MRKSLRLILSVLLLTAVCIPLAVFPSSGTIVEGKAITILFTGDLHDHMLPGRDIRDGMVCYTGGYARKQYRKMKYLQKRYPILMS